MNLFLYSISLQKELSKDIVFCKKHDDIFVVTELQGLLKQNITDCDSIVYFGGHSVLNSLFNVGFPKNINYTDLQHFFWNIDTSVTNITLECAFTKYIDISSQSNINIQNAINNIQVKAFSLENEKTTIIKNNSIINDLNVVFFAMNHLFDYVNNTNISYADVVDNELCKTIAKLENTNTNIDKEYVLALRNNINAKLENILYSLYALVGHPFNINSQRELNFILKNIGVLNNKLSNIELTNSYNQTGLLIFKYIDQYRKLKVCSEQFIKPLYNQSIKDGFGRFKYNTCKVPCLTKGHFCFIKEKGIVDISEVCVNDSIWTEYGFKKVIRAKHYKTNEIVCVEFSNGISICGTKHHPILLNVSKETDKSNYTIKREWCTLEHLFVGEKAICNYNYKDLRTHMFTFIQQKGLFLCDIINKYASLTMTNYLLLDNVRFSNVFSFQDFKALSELLGLKFYSILRNNDYNVYNIEFYDCCGLHYLLQIFDKFLKQEIKEKIREICSINKQIQDYSNYCNYDYEEVFVTKIIPINDYRIVYDIEVEDVHQYNANGIINHNTGRISSTGSYVGNYKSTINIQSVPKNDIEGVNIRKAFIPNNDCYWCCVDYKAQEVRLVSKLYDIQLLKDIPLEEDIYEHISTMFDVFKHLQIDKKIKRTAIKIITLGVIYGLTNYGIQRQLKQIGITDDINFRESFFAVFPELKTGQERTLNYAHAVNGIYTLSGRFRKIEFTKNDRNVFFTRNNRIALNTIIQGTCGDIIRVVLNHIATTIEPVYANYGFSVLNTIHDEINFSIPSQKEIFNLILKDILYIMTTPIKERPDIKFGCSISIGDNWGNLTNFPFGG